jgi:hypothetical protein
MNTLKLLLFSCSLVTLPVSTQALFTSLPPTCNLDIGDIVVGPPEPGEVLVGGSGNDTLITPLPVAK